MNSAAGLLTHLDGRQFLQKRLYVFLSSLLYLNSFWN